MSHNSSRDSVLWTGKPWILPSALVRSISVAVIAVVVFWFEFFSEVAGDNIMGVPVIVWTGLVFFVIWLLSLLP
jgi:hypothetical protein